METLEQLTEQEIISRIINGEQSLFELIVRRFNPYLYKIGRSYDYNHDDTQDLMQDTFVDAYKSLAKFEGRSSFKTWISRIMLNHCYKKRNKSSFKNEIMKEINENSKPLFHQSNQETSTIVQNNELGNIIEKALMQIPEKYRMVFAIREINNMSVAETAELLNITESNVKVRLNRAKTMLQEIITESYAAEELYEFHARYCDKMVNRVMNIINTL
ncbi:MAG TPA: sigma-70 family RNA polymerase sigma factor [Edaphocola sp.]|nr:sigma-70 family RNA polymerase sigma factor [Edaphocola sp.]